MSDEVTSLDAGTLLGRFEVIRLRGKGGMGEVYEAHDPELDRAVALKVLPPGRDEAWQRLLREAQALARLAHPNVVSVHDVGVAEGRVFVAMEFVDGETLDVHLAARPRSWRTTLALFVQAARGLVAAHERALVHRDFKPSNVLVDRAGRVRVSDFGLARLALEDEVSGASAPSQDPSFGSRETVDASDPTLDRSPDAGQRLGAQLTGAGAVIGTPRYMAPEQRAGRRATARSDQYAFCLTFWEALAGDVPPAEPRGAPGWLVRALRRGLASDPTTRFASMADLLDVLERTPARRRWWGVAAGALVPALAIGGVWLASASPAVDCSRVAAARRVAGLWAAPARERVRAAFLATGRGHAAAAFERVDRAVAAHLDAWSAARADACAATHERGEQSETVLDLRMRCLDRARERLGTLLSVWEHDGVDVDRAVTAITGDDDVGACGDVAWLATAVPPPRDPELRRRVDAIGGEVHRGRALWEAGKVEASLKVSSAAVAQAREVGHAPALAEALYTQGVNECNGGTIDTGLAALAEGVRVAAEARDDVLLARTQLQTLLCLGPRAHRYAEATALFPSTEAAVLRAGNRDALRASLLACEGAVQHENGKYAESAELKRQAIALFERLGRAYEVDLARTYSGLGNSLRVLGRLEEAQQAGLRAVELFERTVGEEHPNSAQALGNLAVVFNTSGRYDRAEVYAVRAVGAAERMFPAESVQLVPSLITLSNVRRNQQRGTEARGLVERAAAICEKANHPCRLQVLSNLAIIIADGQDHARAVPLLERVLALKETQYGADHPSVADTLNGLSRSRIELGDLARARADAERAAAIWHKAGQPKEREALWHLGQIALAEHKLAEALRHHEQGLAMYDDDPHNPYRVAALRGVGEVQLAMGQTAAAVATLEQAVRLAEEKSGEIPPFEPSYSRFLLGRALWATGDRARAATLAKAGLATLPDGYPDVRDEMNRWIAQLPGR